MESRTDPQDPSPQDPEGGDDLGKVFDRAAPAYDRTGVKFFGPLGEQLVNGLDLLAGESVLDVGCGRGACTVPAAQAVGPAGTVTGIDASSAMMDGAQRELDARGLQNVTLLEGDALAPDFPPESFDAVVAGLVVFMLPDPVKALAAYRDRLRPGGTLGISLFGRDDPRFFEVTNAVLPFLAGGMPPVPGRSDSPFATPEGTAKVLRDCGFDAVRVRQEDLDLEFVDPQQWWDWLWQTAGRVVLERIPEDRLPAAKAAAFERMGQVRADRGAYLIHWNVWFGYGRRP